MKEKFSEISERYSTLACDMIDLINNTIAELTENGKKVLVPNDYPLISEDFNEFKYYEGEGTFVVNYGGNNFPSHEQSIEDLFMDDLFNILTFLTSKEYTIQ